MKETIRSCVTEEQVEVTEIVNRVEQRKMAAEKSSQIARNVFANLASDIDTGKKIFREGSRDSKKKQKEKKEILLRVNIIVQRVA